MKLHREVDPTSTCGGQVNPTVGPDTAARKLFKSDYWCVYCGAKFNKPEERQT